MTTMDYKLLRALIIDALPEHAQAENSDLSSGQRFLPIGHINALQLDRPLVEGGRGSGKTFWLRSLLDKSARESMASAFDVQQLKQIDVRCGFNPYAPSEDYPGSKVIDSLLRQKISMVDFWFAVVVGLCIPDALKAISWSSLSWPERCQSVRDHAEIIDNSLRAENEVRRLSNTPLLIVFDGLDRAASGEWSQVTEVARGLLQTVLEFSRFDAIRLKAFLRDDVVADPAVRRFPDASKLFANSVRLEWSSEDLYGLLWQYLGNASGSKPFRDWSEEVVQRDWKDVAGVHVLPDTLRREAGAQERLFHQVAGERMGPGLKRGNTWTWLPKHLSDTRGYTSPRSFLVALRAAAEKSDQYQPIKQHTALHWRAIEAGVRDASKVRRHEIGESHPWMDDVLDALTGLSLPARRQDIVSRWRRDRVTSKIRERVENNGEPLALPRGFSADDPGSLLDVLEQIGLCSRRNDGRIDFPDIVRIAANMPRKGGVALK